MPSTKISSKRTALQVHMEQIDHCLSSLKKGDPLLVDEMLSRIQDSWYVITEYIEDLESKNDLLEELNREHRMELNVRGGI